MNETHIENALQAAAPSLPPALQAQTLRACRLEFEQSERNYRRIQRVLCGAIVAVCAIQWLVVGRLDAQSSQWVNAGNASSNVRVASEQSARNASPDAIAAFGWRADMRERKFALTALMSEPNEMTR